MPYVFTAPWVQDLFIFTVMYAALASAWNIVGGYSGYISLGHAAFFGLGAYAVAILFEHISIGGGYRPFFVLPLVGVAVGIASLPIAWVAYRTRAATFAIVTITLLFVAQQLAFNLHETRPQVRQRSRLDGQWLDRHVCRLVRRYDHHIGKPVVPCGDHPRDICRLHLI